MIAVRWEDILRIAALALLVGCILVSVVTRLSTPMRITVSPPPSMFNTAFVIERASHGSPV